jgi:hypothetical protein
MSYFQVSVFIIAQRYTIQNKAFFFNNCKLNAFIHSKTFASKNDPRPRLEWKSFLEEKHWERKAELGAKKNRLHQIFANNTLFFHKFIDLGLCNPYSNWIEPNHKKFTSKI